MLKKCSWLVAVLVAFMLLFTFASCGDDNGDPDPNGPNGPNGPDPGPTVVKPADTLFELTLGDNFQWGTGYQGFRDDADTFASSRVSIGDVYSLKFSFVAERDFTDKLYVGLVDPTEAASWWQPLTWPGDPVDPELVAGEGAVIKRGEVVTADLTLIAIADSTADGIAANRIVFQTECEQGTGGTAGSGVLGPIVLYFTEFEFKKVGTVEFSLAGWLEQFPDVTVVQSATGNPIRPGSSNVNNISITPNREDNSFDVSLLSGNHALCIIIGTHNDGLSLKTSENMYELRIAGTVTATPSGATLEFRYNEMPDAVNPEDVSGNQNTFLAFPIETGAAFDMVAVLPRTVSDPGSGSGSQVRFIQAGSTDFAGVVLNVTDITIINKGAWD